LCTVPSTCRASIKSRWNQRSLSYPRHPLEPSESTAETAARRPVAY
jgi:hypothetical protein